MKYLFLIDGAAGTGKTDMVEYIREKYSRGNLATIIVKLTTRKLRKEEIDRKFPLDLAFILQKTFDQHAQNEQFYS